MTYKKEMVLPKNAVAMNNEDMMCVEGSLSNLAWAVIGYVGGKAIDCIIWPATKKAFSKKYDPPKNPHKR